MNNYSAIVKQGKMEMQTDFMRERFKIFLKNHEGARIEFVPIVPESKNQRKFYHGAVIPLWVYLDGKDHRNSDILEQQHEIAKLEFNSTLVVSNGKTYRIGQTSKQKLATGFIETIIGYLQEQYGIDPMKVLNPIEYKKWKNEIYPFGGADNFVDYMVEIGLLHSF